MLERVKGDKTFKVPEKVIIVGIVGMTLCSVVADICNTISKKK